MRITLGQYANDTLALVQKLITNNAAKLSVNQALHSVMCNENGSVIDHR